MVDIKMPDGAVMTNVPDGTPPEQVLAAWQEYRKQQQGPTWKRALTEPVKAMAGIGEAALNFGTGMPATIAGGLSGLAVGGANALGFDTGRDAAGTVHDVQSALTYEPRLDEGRLAAETVGYPFAKLAEGADIAGGAVAEKSGSPLLGAATNAGIQFAPAALTRGRGKPAVAENPEVAARAWVSRNTALDWNALSDSFRSALTDVAKTAGNLERLDPAAVQRQGRLQSLEIPATRGQITRDPVQLRNEGNVSATEAGAPIREVYDAQNRAVVSNLETIRDSTRGKAGTQEQTGSSVQMAARGAKERQVNRTDKAYEAARESPEAAAIVDPISVLEIVDRPGTQQHFGFARSYLEQFGLKPGDGIALGDLEGLRQLATKERMSADGTHAYYAGELVRAIDQVEHNAGGELFRGARRERVKQGNIYEEQGAVAKLVEDKSRMDPVTPPEKTFQTTVLGSGSIDGLRQVKQVLLSRDGAKSGGVQAFRDLRAQTVQYIIEEATKGVAPLKDGSPNVSAAKFKGAVDRIGRDKLEVLFNKKFVDQIYQVLEATRDIKTEPPAGFKGSPTFANLLAFLEKGAKKIPVVGDTVVGVMEVGKKVRDIGKASRDVRSSLKSPIEEAAQLARDQLDAYANINNAMVAGIPSAEQSAYRTNRRQN